MAEDLNQIVYWPHGAASTQSVTSGATMDVTLGNAKEVVTISQMSAAGTLNITHADVKVGDELAVKVSADGTARALTLGTLVNGTAQTIAANKSHLLMFEYTGSNYDLKSNEQLD